MPPWQYQYNTNVLRKGFKIAFDTRIAVGFGLKALSLDLANVSQWFYIGP